MTFQLRKQPLGNSLVVQWLGLRASTAGGPGLIPSRGTEILYAAWHGQKKTTIREASTIIGWAKGFIRFFP